MRTKLQYIAWSAIAAAWFSTFFEYAVRSLPRRNIDDRLGELVGVPRAFGVASHSGFLSGRSISSYEGTWVLSDQDSNAAPQTVQTASPVCGTKNFSSVRLYSAPQLHCTIVAIPAICASDRRFSSPELCHNRTDPLSTRQQFRTKNHLRILIPRELSLSKCLPGYRCVPKTLSGLMR